MDEDDIGSVPLVIDNGGGQIKADFAGTVDHPRTIFETLVGKPKHTRAMIGVMPESECVRCLTPSPCWRRPPREHPITHARTPAPLPPHPPSIHSRLIGPKAQANRGILQLRHPIERGVVTDWDAMEKIWSYVYQSLGSDSAAVQTEDHPVLLTEAVQNPVSNRQKAAEVLFESFSIPALYVPQQATLSLYASGRTTGLVLNCGDGVTHAVPIVNGFALPHATTRADYGGRDVTERLQLLARAAGYAFHTSAEKESVRMLKEAKCYVAFNPSKEERYQIEEQQRLVKDNFELPDGRILQIGAERFRAPELLFDPTLIGLEFPGIHQVRLSLSLFLSFSFSLSPPPPLVSRHAISRVPLLPPSSLPTPHIPPWSFN